MRQLLNILFGLTILLSACEPKAAEPIQIGKVWKAQQVSQNGTLVYQEGSSTNTRPSYSLFRLDLSVPEQVVFTDLDSRRTTGTWSLSTNNLRLILENLVPPPSESIGNVEFYIDGYTPNQLKLKRTTESRKTGNSVNEYVLIPE